jgi:rod shape-determining protein MreB
MEALDEPLSIICEAIHRVLEMTPPELAADISNSGIVITGGGALLHGIDKRVEQRTGITTTIAENPMDCVAIGTGKALDSMLILENAALNKRKSYM